MTRRTEESLLVQYLLFKTHTYGINGKALKQNAGVCGKVYSAQERSRQKPVLFVSSVGPLNLPFFHVPLQHSSRARPQWCSPNQSNSALSIYPKIRSDLERLLLENMEQFNSHCRTQNSKCTNVK